MAADLKALRLSAAQKRWLKEVCRTSGGGVRVACRVLDDGEVVPTSPPLRQLYDKGLIQGKSGAYSTVVHTRDGWEVNAELNALSTCLPSEEIEDV